MKRSPSMSVFIAVMLVAIVAGSIVYEIIKIMAWLKIALL